MIEKLTPRLVQRLLQAHAQEILEQIGDEDVTLGVSLHDSDACLHVSVRPEQVGSIPKTVHVSTAEGLVDIPVTATGDYEPFELQ